MFFKCLCLSLLFGLIAVSFAQPVFVVPVENSTWQRENFRIITVFPQRISDQETVHVEVTGSLSGRVATENYLSEDNCRLVFTPVQEFLPGETVNAVLKWPGGEKAWSFTIRPMLVDQQQEGFPSMPRMQMDPPSDQVLSRDGVSVPPDFPEIILNSPGQPEDGNFFFASLNGSDATNSSYFIIMDNTGEPVFYWHWNKGIFCPELQTTGDLTFATRLAGNVISWLIMDDSYAIVDTFTVEGFQTDLHGIDVRDNGNVILIGQDSRYIDMSQIVPNGNPNALVHGLVIQEQDENHIPIFEWNSFDHFPITDAAHYKDLTAPTIDYVHCNSIADDIDGNYLISCNAMNQCVKIDATTGDIIWRFGGLDADTSHFTLVNDPLGGFSTQHDFQTSGEGLYTLFDNGRFHSPKISRGLEYQLDTDAMTATIVWSYQESGLYGSHLGSCQKLPSGDYVVGWGDITGTTTFADVSEINASGGREIYFRFQDSVLESYRAYKFDWEGQALVPYLVVQGNSSGTAAILTYNVFGSIEYDTYRIWQGTDPDILSPVLLTPENQIGLWDLPQGWNYFAVTALNGSGETDPSNIDSVLVDWTGVMDENVEFPLSCVTLQPNPACNLVSITFPSNGVESQAVELFDLTGRSVLYTMVNTEGLGTVSSTLDVSDLRPGVYSVLVRGSAEDFTGRLVVINSR